MSCSIVAESLATFSDLVPVVSTNVGATLSGDTITPTSTLAEFIPPTLFSNPVAQKEFTFKYRYTGSTFGVPQNHDIYFTLTGNTASATNVPYYVYLTFNNDTDYPAGVGEQGQQFRVGSQAQPLRARPFGAVFPVDNLATATNNFVVQYSDIYPIFFTSTGEKTIKGRIYLYSASGQPITDTEITTYASQTPEVKGMSI